MELDDVRWTAFVAMPGSSMQVRECQCPACEARGCQRDDDLPGGFIDEREEQPKRQPAFVSGPTNTTAGTGCWDWDPFDLRVGNI